jgi:hypothetical protein
MDKNNPNLLLDSNRGVYIPQVFATDFDIKLPAKIKADLKAGPRSENYWESWNWVLDNVTFVEEGTKYSLYQDGDLWAIPEGFDIGEWLGF